MILKSTIIFFSPKSRLYKTVKTRPLKNTPSWILSIARSWNRRMRRSSSKTGEYAKKLWSRIPFTRPEASSKSPTTYRKFSTTFPPTREESSRQNLWLTPRLKYRDRWAVQLEDRKVVTLTARQNRISFQNLGKADSPGLKVLLQLKNIKFHTKGMKRNSIQLSNSFEFNK